jgi:hypothetical protein
MAMQVEELVPQIDEISMEVAQTVYERMSHDHLDTLALKETARLFNGPEPMLRVIWTARWFCGGKSDLLIMLPERDALSHLDRTRQHLEHRLMREVFRIDAEIGAAEPVMGLAAA